MSFPSNARIIPFCVLGLAGMVATPSVFATDQEIKDDLTTKVDTTALLGTSGTLTITSAGSITVSSGPALTLTGNHSLDMSGLLQSNDKTNALGLGVYTESTDDLRLTSTIDIDGDFVINGPDDENTASNNIGLGIFGNGIFEGDLTISNGSSFNVAGGNSKAVYIESGFVGDIFIDAAVIMKGEGSVGVELAGDVTGDVTIDGSIAARYKGTVGVQQTGVIDGEFIHMGSIGVGASETTDDDGNDVDAQPAVAGILIGNDVTGGVLLRGKSAADESDDDDTIASSSIYAYGGGPALLVQNMKDDGSDLTLSAFGDTGYGLVHRGTIYSYGESSGNDALGMSIIGGENGERSVIEGGIYVDGGRIDANAIDGVATALELGAGADVPEILSLGVIEATTSVTANSDGTYTAGGDAYGIVVDEDATLGSFTNEGTVNVSASGSGNGSYGIVDQSGTLTTIVNEGSWYVTNGTNNGGPTIAIDVSANTSGVTFTNKGTFVGDVLLGSGNDNVTLSDGSFTGDIDFGLGADSFTVSGEATFNGSMSHEGTLDFYLTGADLTLASDAVVNVTNARFDNDSTLYVNIDPTDGAAGHVVASGNVVVTDGVTISPKLSTFVQDEETFEIIDAGNLVFDGTFEAIDDSYLMESSISFSEDGNSLLLTVRRKTAEDLSLSGNRATLYNSLFDTLDPEDDLGGAMAGIADADEFEDALQTLMPDTTAAAPQLAYSAAKQLSAGLNDRMLELTHSKRITGGFWAREAVGLGDMTGKTSGQAVNYLGAGVLLGYDKEVSDNVLWGIGSGFLLQGVSRVTEIGDDVSIFSPYLQTYLIAHSGSAFASLSGSFWYNNITRDRALEIGGVEKAIESRSHGYIATADAQAGYDLKLGGLHLRPQVGVSYMTTHEGGYTEEGGDGANLVIDARSYSRMDGVGQISLGHDFHWSGKGESATKIRPELFATYRKRLSGNKAVLTTARFASSEDWFTLDNDAVADNSFEMGGALNIFADFGVASLRYTYEKRGEWIAHYGGFNFQMRF